MDKYTTSLKTDYMEISTAPLKKRLKNTEDIDKFLKENISSITDPTLSQHLNKLLSQKGLKRKDVIAPANLDINYINQLFNGKKKKPNRDIILSLAFGFSLNYEETDRLLKIAGVGALYPKNKRDAIISYALENALTMNETDVILQQHNLEPLYKEK